MPPTEEMQERKPIEIRPVDPARTAAELQRCLEKVQLEVQKLEAAKAVSQEAMQTEVSI